MLRHPYLANAVARLPVVNASDLDWCTTMATDGYYIYVDPGFCNQITEEELTAVIAHEILHCVLGHMDRRGVRDRRSWNVAIDYAVNLLLVDAGFQLPKNGLLDRNFRGMTAEEIYDSLESRADAGGQVEAEEKEKRAKDRVIRYNHRSGHRGDSMIMLSQVTLKGLQRERRSILRKGNAFACDRR